MKLEQGRAYFDVGYSEHDLIVPNIETYIFIGKNLLSSNEDRYYFQTPDSFFKYGPFNEVSEEKLKQEIEILSLTEEWVAELYTIQSLVSLLEVKNLEFSDYFGTLIETKNS